MNPYTDKQPPQDPAAEKEVLACACLDPERTIYECAKAGVTAASFFVPVHREVWAAIHQSFVAHGFVDVTGITTRFRQTQTAEGFDVDSAIEKCTVPDHAGFYINRIRDMEKRRGMIQAMHAAAVGLTDTTTETGQVMAEYEAAATKTLALSGMAIHQLGDYQAAKLEQWTAAQKTGFVGVPCHIQDVTAALGGWRKGCVSIVGAYRGAGKSTWLRSDAKWNAKSGRPVALFSLEDPGDIASAAMVCDDADVSSLDLDTGKALPGDIDRARRAWDSIAGLPLYIVSEKCTMPQIMAAASLFKMRHNIEAIYLDHIQYITPLQLPHMTRNDTMSVYSSELAGLAKRLNIAVICASQLNRSAEKDNRAPRLSDLRDSGSLEQDARAVGLLYWSDPDDCFVFEVAKNNYGKSGVKVYLWRQGGKRFVVNPNRGTPYMGAKNEQN